MLDELSKTLSPRLMLLLLIAVAVLILSSGYSGLFKQPVKDYRQLETQYQNLKQQPYDPEAITIEINKLEQEIMDLNQKLTEKGREILKGTKAIKLISDLGSYAKTNNLQLLGVSPAELVIGKHYSETPFRLELTGEYAQLYKFVYTLEHSNMPLFIKDFTLSPGETVDSRNMKLTLSLIQPLKDS